MRLLGAIAVILFIGAAALFWQFERPPIPIEGLRTIKPMASQDEVEAAFGKPTSIYQGGRKWAYSRAFGWSIVYVHFDNSGRFERYEYDK